MKSRTRQWIAPGLLLLATVGCSTISDTLGFNTPTSPLLKETKELRDTAPVPAPVPRELAKELLPPHVVEPGDTLLVQPVELDSPIRLPPDQPVQPDGTIDLGKYGRPVVVGKTLAQIEVQVREIIRAREMTDRKEKDGKEPKEAREAWEGSHAVTIRLLGRPGKVYYVLGEVNAPGAFPITGRETVLDGIVAAGGPTKRASESNIVLARPTAPDGCRLVYPVCYKQITQMGDTSTNYQLRPGDRIFVPSKGTFEGVLPARCQKGVGACSHPQFSCFGGGCATGSCESAGSPQPGGAVPAPTTPAVTPPLPALP
jgi:protein involved in polysaccharide export with SLBB domain